MTDFRRQFETDFGASSRECKPSVVPWHAWYATQLRLPGDAAQTRLHRVHADAFAEQARATLRGALGDNLSTVAELVLDGDVDTAAYQIDRLQGRFESTYRAADERALLHYAVLAADSVRMASMLLERGCDALLNERDCVSGQTPLHLAVFVGSRDLLRLLAAHAACDFGVVDNFRATPADYARMLDYLPPLPSLETPLVTLCDDAGVAPRTVGVGELERRCGVRFVNATLCDLRYCFELSFSGLTMEARADAFRERHGAWLWRAVEPTRCVVARVSDAVGDGLFAGVALSAGDFVCRYGALATAASGADRRDYCVQSGVPGVVLDASAYRGLGAFVNHAPREHANVELNCIFERGAEQVFLVATRDIARGEQLLADYGRAYFRARRRRDEEERDDDSNDEESDERPATCGAQLWGARRGELPSWLPALTSRQ